MPAKDGSSTRPLWTEEFSVHASEDTYVLRRRTGEEVKVTEGRFTVVAIDEQGRPRPVPRQDPA